jgi:hypothetical protein
MFRKFVIREELRSGLSEAINLLYEITGKHAYNLES